MKTSEWLTKKGPFGCQSVRQGLQALVQIADAVGKHIIIAEQLVTHTSRLSALSCEHKGDAGRRRLVLKMSGMACVAETQQPAIGCFCIVLVVVFGLLSHSNHVIRPQREVMASATERVGQIMKEAAHVMTRGR